MCRVSIPGRGWGRRLPEHPAAIPGPWLCSLPAEWGRVCVPGCQGPVALVLCTHVRGSLTSPCPAAARQCHLQQSHCCSWDQQPGTQHGSAQVTIPAGVSLQGLDSAALLITLFSVPLSIWQKVLQPVLSPLSLSLQQMKVEVTSEIC